MKEHFDGIGNPINVGNEVLILVPKSDRTYRQGIVKDFKNPFSYDPSHFHCDVLVEYDDNRLYCNEYRWDQHQGHNIKFTKKTTKAWRSNSDIIKFKKEYLEDENSNETKNS